MTPDLVIFVNYFFTFFVDEQSPGLQGHQVHHFGRVNVLLRVQLLEHLVEEVAVAVGNVQVPQSGTLPEL